MIKINKKERGLIIPHIWFCEIFAYYISDDLHDLLEIVYSWIFYVRDVQWKVQLMIATSDHDKFNPRHYSSHTVNK